MPITMFDHYTLRSSDIDATARFYADVMGFRVERLDAFAFPFRLLFLGDHAVVTPARRRAGAGCVSRPSRTQPPR